MSRVAGMPIMKQQKVTVPAKYYNLWRRAKLHLPLPIRFPLEGYRGLVLLIDESEWLCADERQNDMPVICWYKFDDKHRDAIHLPIPCQLNYYHFGAATIQEHVLELMEVMLEERIKKHQEIFTLGLKDPPE